MVLNIHKLCKNAGQQLNAMRRMHKHLGQNSRNSIYSSFIKSNFNYCPIVWMFANKTDLLKLEAIQVRALRFVHRDFYSNKEEILTKSNESKVRIMNLRSLAIEVYKCMNGLNPEYIRQIIEAKSVNYSLRNANNPV